MQWVTATVPGCKEEIGCKGEFVTLACVNPHQHVIWNTGAHPKASDLLEVKYE